MRLEVLPFDLVVRDGVTSPLAESFLCILRRACWRAGPVTGFSARINLEETDASKRQSRLGGWLRSS